MDRSLFLLTSESLLKPRRYYSKWKLWGKRESKAMSLKVKWRLEGNCTRGYTGCTRNSTKASLSHGSLLLSLCVGQSWHLLVLLVNCMYRTRREREDWSENKVIFWFVTISNVFFLIHWILPISSYNSNLHLMLEEQTWCEKTLHVQFHNGSENYTILNEPWSVRVYFWIQLCQQNNQSKNILSF